MDVQFIVSRLNEAPFRLGLSLVDFDEKSPLEVLQILNDVLTAIDEKMKADVRNESEEERAIRMTEFLLTLKCKDVPPDEEDRLEWMEDLGGGKKDVVCPILHWCLSMYEKLRKRAYLAPFLIPVELPLELTMREDSSLSELADRYGHLQAEFKETHRRYESVRKSTKGQGSELKKEIHQLEDERQQLEDRIETLRERADDEFSGPGFERTLDATSAMRKEQDDEIRLQDRLKEQTHNLSVSEQKLKQIQRRLRALRFISSGGNSAEEILQEIQNEVSEVATAVRSGMMTEQRKMEKKIAQLEKERLEPMRTEEDLDAIRENVLDLEEEISEVEKQVKSASKKNDGNKVAMFKQHANLATAKLKEKEAELESKEAELEGYRSLVHDLQVAAGDAAAAERDRTVEGPGGRPMTRADLTAFGHELREKNRRHGDARRDLSETRAESVVLRGTERTLRGRVENVEDFLRKREERAGVAGYREARTGLEKTSERAAELNERKGQTLEEISEVVSNITNTLERKKVHLEPLIQELKEMRARFASVQRLHDDKKARYDRMSARFASDRQILENDCDLRQEEWLREERTYHHLRSLNYVARSDLDRVRMEEDWRAGRERFLPDFAGLSELYEGKFQRQEDLARELRKEQRRIKENEVGNARQRAMFGDLRRLLDLRLRTARRAAEEGARERAELDALRDEPLNVGGAQVLTFG